MQDPVTLYKAMGCNMSLKIHFLKSHLDFSQKITAKSVANTKDFTKTLWLWKRGTKAKWTSSMLADCCWTLKRDVHEANYRASHTPLHFRGTFLPVSLAHKVLFCTNIVLCNFETLPDRKILYIYISQFNIKSTAEFIYRSLWDQKKEDKFC